MAEKTISWFEKHYKTYQCKSCKKETVMRSNSYYCDDCVTKLRERGAFHYIIGNLDVWIRNNVPVMVMDKNKEGIKTKLLGKELIPE